MNLTLIKALILLVLTSVLLAWSAREFVKRTAFSSLRALGAGCLVIVALTHICEALGWFPAMHWGAEHSAGHYLDLSSAVLGVTLLLIGYLFRRAAGPAK